MKNFQPSVKVECNFNPDEIHLTTVMTDMHGIENSFAHGVMRLREQAVRDALIALGWTPPATDAASLPTKAPKIPDVGKKTA